MWQTVVYSHIQQILFRNLPSLPFSSVLVSEKDIWQSVQISIILSISYHRDLMPQVSSGHLQHRVRFSNVADQHEDQPVTVSTQHSSFFKLSTTLWNPVLPWECLPDVPCKCVCVCFDVDFAAVSNVWHKKSHLDTQNSPPPTHTHTKAQSQRSTINYSKSPSVSMSTQTEGEIKVKNTHRVINQCKKQNNSFSITCCQCLFL